jgi:hypothetical protein
VASADFILLCTKQGVPALSMACVGIAWASILQAIALIPGFVIQVQVKYFLRHLQFLYHDPADT